MRSKTLLGTVTLLFVFAVVTAGCSTNTTTPANTTSPTPTSSNVSQNTTAFIDYVNSTLGLRLEYPSGWKVLDRSKDDTKSISFTSPAGNQLIYVSQDPNTNNLSLDKITNALTQLYSDASKNNTLISSENTTLGGLPAHKFVYKNVGADGTQSTFVSITALKDDKEYNILSINSESTTDGMARSFSFTT